MSRRARRQGITLVEMMMVVAIIGVLSALAAGFTIAMVRSSRVNSMAHTLTSLLASARQRAVTTACPHFVEVHGPTFVGALPVGAPVGPARMFIARKANCASTTLWFELGDRVVDEAILGDDAAFRQTLRLRPDVGLMTPETLGAGAFLISYDRLGRRAISVDDDGDGTFVDNTAFDGVDLNVIIEETPPGSATSDFQVRMRVPVANAARLVN